MIEHLHIIGVDLGQSRDPTAIAIVRKVGDGDAAEFHVGHLQRMPLRTPYPAIVHHVAGLLMKLPGAELVIDHTGVGRPVADLFNYEGISPIGVNITAGTTETRDGRIYGVPKMALISRLQALFSQQRLLILKDLAEAETLVRELQDYQIQYTAAGTLTANARQGRHDDLVLALAIAVWRAYGSSVTTCILTL